MYRLVLLTALSIINNKLKKISTKHQKSDTMQEINLNSENINRQNIFPTAIDEKSRVLGEKSINKLSQETHLSGKLGKGQVEGKSL